MSRRPVQCLVSAGSMAIVLALCGTTELNAQEAKSKKYSIRMSEFRLDAPAGSEVSNKEILEQILDRANRDKVEEIETLRLTAMDGIQTMVQFGRRLAMTVGSSGARPGRPPVRQKQMVSIGTIVQLTAKSSGEDSCNLELRYEASRPDGEPKEDEPPEIVNSRIGGSYEAKVGEPVLLGGTNSNGTKFLVLIIEK